MYLYIAFFNEGLKCVVDFTEANLIFQSNLALGNGGILRYFSEYLRVM